MMSRFGGTEQAECMAWALGGCCVWHAVRAAAVYYADTAQGGAHGPGAGWMLRCAALRSACCPSWCHAVLEGPAPQQGCRLSHAQFFLGSPASSSAGRARSGRLELVLHHHLPIFHTEHCVFARFLSDGNSFRCGTCPGIFCLLYRVCLFAAVFKECHFFSVTPLGLYVGCHCHRCRHS
jgi:hypothetical protein